MASLNLFPVNLVSPSGQEFRTVRVDTKAKMVRAWVWADKMPKLLTEWPVDDVEVDTTSGRLAITDNGWEVRRARGCGCNHPMKRFRPPADTATSIRVEL